MATHKPIPLIQVVEKLIEVLSFRQVGVVREEYAVSADGMKMFWGDGPDVRISGLPICNRLAKHAKNFLLEASLAVGVDRMERNPGPLK